MNNVSYLINCWLIILCLSIGSQLNGQVIALPNAHSHNDYDQKQPLKAALAHGFTSVEADVVLINGRLKVAHDLPQKDNPSIRTLDLQYLNPLYRQYKKNNDQIYDNYDGEFYLWIDIKMNPEEVYQLLKQQLYPYRDMLNHYNQGIFHKGKVTVILSGHRPFETLLHDTLQLMTLDGRPDDLKLDYPTSLMPFISERARKVARVGFLEKIDDTAFEHIAEYVRRTHEQGKKTRLWATPEKEEVWEKLLSIGIDLINTDDLSRLQRFLLKQ